jgi:hypothetical protein
VMLWSLVMLLGRAHVGYDGFRVQGYDGFRVQGYDGFRVRGYDGFRVHAAGARTRRVWLLIGIRTLSFFFSRKRSVVWSLVMLVGYRV